MGESSRGSVVAEVWEIARGLGVDTLRREDFAKGSSTRLYRVYNPFTYDGWRGVPCAAGLRVPIQTVATLNDTLLKDLRRVVSQMGRIPTGIQHESRGDFSFAVSQKRLGGFQGTLKRYLAWLKQHRPDAGPGGREAPLGGLSHGRTQYMQRLQKNGDKSQEVPVRLELQGYTS
jgi:hypothetical protein